AITSKLTVDVAYVGNHGYREEFNTDLNQPALGAGYDQATINACLKSQPVYNKCKPAGPEVGQYAATFPYISGIDAVSKGQFSNYDALQVPAQGRAYHGLSFLSGYTYSHALGE